MSVLKPLALLALLLAGAACADERPQATNPNWSPPQQAGNRP